MINKLLDTKKVYFESGFCASLSYLSEEKITASHFFSTWLSEDLGQKGSLEKDIQKHILWETVLL